MGNPLKTTQAWIVGLASLGLILIVMLIIYGNLSGNLGFAAASQGANDTNAVINNFTAAARNVGSQFPTVGTFIGLGLLLAVLIGIAVLAIRGFNKAGSGGRDGSSFG